MDIFSITVTLFLIMDPFGNIPLFLPILERVPKERRRRVLVRELFLALAVIVIFTLGGKFIMRLLGLQQASVSIAGGIILFLIAIRMVFPRQEADASMEIAGEPLLVPLAVPLVSGPSLLAALLLFSSTGTIRLPELLLAAFAAWVATFVILYFSTYIVDFLTKRGLVAMERLMGMILVAVAVQLFLSGLGEYLR
ncbi:MAG: NAAT family transporter [candidate division Zixibacteria bacterium]|nr:NAAT family transporter [candidate division Zixibacteria bacterium]